MDAKGILVTPAIDESIAIKTTSSTSRFSKALLPLIKTYMHEYIIVRVMITLLLVSPTIKNNKIKKYTIFIS